MAVQNSLTKGNQRLGMTAYLTNDAVKNQINSVIGGKNGTRFISSVVSAVNNNPALQECTNQSILNAALLGESLNLSPSPQLGYYYMVPFNDHNKGKVAQFQLGYKGYIQLAIRSGQYKKINVLAVKEGELQYFDPMNEEIKVELMIDNWDEREKAKTIGYYAMFELTNGFRKAIYWSKEQMEAHAIKYSKGYQAKKGFTFWEKDFDAMAYKTMLRQLISKWGIMSIDMVNAMDADMAVINEDGSKSYVENDDENIVDVGEAEPVSKAQPASEMREIHTEQTDQDAAQKQAPQDVQMALFGK